MENPSRNDALRLLPRKLKWYRRFLKLAEHVSYWSKDPSTKVGAVIVDKHNRVVGMGYNGFPRGVMDHEERYADRPTKYKYVVHAELNAILNAAVPVDGATIFTYPFAPCTECAKAIIQAGIDRVVTIKSNLTTHSAHHDVDPRVKTMFTEAIVSLTVFDFTTNRIEVNDCLDFRVYDLNTGAFISARALTDD